MNSKKLAWHRENGRFEDSKFDRLAAIGDKREEEEEEKKKALAITFTSCNTDDKNFNLTFQITGKNLKRNNAKIYVGEKEVFGSEEAVPATSVIINANGKVNVTVSFSKEKTFSKTWFEGDFEYIAEISCDGLSAETNEFRLKCAGINKIKSICERELTVEEVKKIVKLLRENTYYDAKNPKTGKKEKFLLTNLPWYSVDKIFHRNNVDIDEKFKDEIVTNNTFENFTAQLNKIFKKYDINNCKRRCHFIAQIYIETEYFTKTIESDNSKTYKYDPWRGRGFIHLTHKESYKKYTNHKREKDKSNINFENNYTLISTNLEFSADASGWFWKYNERWGDLNKIADTKTVKEITKAVQGANGALEKRENTYNLLVKFFK
ncbi:hypothetical protein [Flavobacterium sp.]|jgi:predicted chitinase|uniref:hypothetical protein n=1 Tax=Flavobacterium sp. TaxID=239 RepID=UPI0022C5F7A6|nr:hypothetical protein [Flavobacterium sp.]MCZ8144590.1 hypothetical protein [Flavobacterium sp.]